MYKKVRECLKKLPLALKKQALSQMGAGGGFLFLTILIGILEPDPVLLLPGGFVTIYLVGSGLWLLVQTVRGNYIHLQGECIGIETKGIRKRVQSVELLQEQGIVKIPVWGRIGNLSEGEMVELYVSEKAPVYEQEGYYTISEYYAVSIHR